MTTYELGGFNEQLACIDRIRCDAIQRGRIRNASAPELTDITIPVWYILWLTDTLLYVLYQTKKEQAE